MARIRSIKPEFFTDEDVGSLPPLTRLFFIGLWCHADRAGRFSRKVAQIKALVLPYDDADVAQLLAELVKKRFLIEYNVKGKTYYQIRTWAIHQRPHHTEQDSALPPCPNRARTVKEPLDNLPIEEGKGREGKGEEGDSVEPAAPLPVLTFPVVGTDGCEWGLTQTLLDTLQAAYPGVDVKAQCIKAKAWCVANETRRKTPKGMARFLNSWMDRQQNSGNRHNGIPAKPEPKVFSGPYNS